MEPESAFQSYLSGALETFGIEADETERAVMSAVWHAYQEGMDLLAAADLSRVEPELGADLARAPER